MRRDLAALHAWLPSHHGVVTGRNLPHLGLTHGDVRSLVRAGHLVVVRRGIYRSAHVAFDRPQIMAAACLANPHVAVAFTTAGQEWGFRGMADDRIHLLAPHGSSPDLPGVVLHRCRQIDPVDLVAPRPDGIRLTSPPRTLFDSASHLTDDATASAIEQAIAEHRCTIGTLMATSARLSHPNRPGARRFQAVLLGRPTLRGAARSELERIVRAAIEAAGLPEPLVNSWVRLSTGEMVQIDLAWPEWWVAVEVDHPFWHDREAEAARDKRRDRKLAVDGWLPLRVSQTDVDRRLADAVGDIGRVLVRQGWEGVAAHPSNSLLAPWAR